jgi:hypothetical protein
MYGVVLLVVKIATAAAAAALVCLFVMTFVAIDLFIAALAACLCGWLIRSGGPRRRRDPPACVWRRV